MVVQKKQQGVDFQKGVEIEKVFVFWMSRMEGILIIWADCWNFIMVGR